MLFGPKAQHQQKEGKKELRQEREESIQQNLLRQQLAASQAPSRHQQVGYWGGEWRSEVSVCEGEDKVPDLDAVLSVERTSVLFYLLPQPKPNS